MKSSGVMTLLSFVILAAGAGTSHAQSGPTFDCAKADHEIEVLICGDPELQAKDRTLAEIYQQAVEVAQGLDSGAQEAVSELKTTQRGWIGGRNDCWKASDKRQCTADEYDRRSAFLQARYFLVEGSAPVFYDCGSNAEIVATFIPTEPPSVRLERGDSLEIGILSPSASGSRYDADFGVYFWTQGEEAQVAWPQETEYTCTRR